MDFLIIAISGSLGALSRYGIYLYSKHLSDSQFPWATLAINLIGCFFAGLLIGHSTSSPNKHFYTLISLGFIGSFTTFSTLGVETLSLIETREYGIMTLNLCLNLIGGIGLILAGRFLGSH